MSSAALGVSVPLPALLGQVSLLPNAAFSRSQQHLKFSHGKRNSETSLITQGILASETR